MPDTPEKLTRPIARHKWIELRADADDEPYLAASPGTLVVPLNYAGDVLCIRHPARDKATGAARLALPGGPIDAGETPLPAARRILQAHTGFKAEAWFPLGVLAPFANYAQWDVHLFLARNLEPARHMDAAIYRDATARLPLDAIEDAIASGQLRDAVTVAALFMARQAIDGALRINPGAERDDDA